MVIINIYHMNSLYKESLFDSSIKIMLTFFKRGGSLLNIVNNVAVFLFFTIFSIGVVVNLVGPKGIIDSYIRWRMPSWFRFITAALEALALILILLKYEMLGYGLALAVMLAAIVILYFNKELKPLIAPLLTSMLILFLLK